MSMCTHASFDISHCVSHSPLCVCVSHYCNLLYMFLDVFRASNLNQFHISFRHLPIAIAPQRPFELRPGPGASA